MIESGTRIQKNLELITHLQTEMCEFKESIDIEVVKENLEINIYDKAQTFVDNVQDCQNGNSDASISF